MVSLFICSVFFFFFSFFFQAEDGIRDLVRSRGLGDVYKRQRYSSSSINSPKMRGMLPRLISSMMKTHGWPIWAAARQNLTKTPARGG